MLEMVFMVIDKFKIILGIILKFKKNFSFYFIYFDLCFFFFIGREKKKK